MVPQPPQAHGKPFSIYWREAFDTDDLEAGRFGPSRHLRLRQPKPPMRVVGAQELELVRSEIDDQHLSLGLQYPPRLGEHPHAVLEEAGYSDAEIAALIESKVAAVAP